MSVNVLGFFLVGPNGYMICQNIFDQREYSILQAVLLRA